MSAMVAAGELMIAGAGSVTPANFPDEEFDLYSIPAHDRGSSEITVGRAIGSAKQVVRPGDVLLSKIVPHIRRAWVVGPNRGHRMIASGEWIVFRDERLNTRYLRHVLLGDPFHVQFMSTVAGVGGSLLRARPAFVARIQIPLPPLEEQRRIAAILDQADALRAKRREALAHLNELAKSIFLDMFVRDGSEDWPLVTIEQVAAEAKGSIRTGPFGSQLLHSEFVDEGVAVLGIDNAVANDFQWRERRFITKQKYAKLSRYTVRPGDVLITIMGTCGRCAVVPDDIPLAINTKHLCCITVNWDICLPVFLHASFLSHPAARAYLQRTAKGAIMSGLNMAIIKGMPLTLPPLALQARFAQRLEAVQASRNLHHASNEALDSLFESLQARAFSGRL